MANIYEVMVIFSTGAPVDEKKVEDLLKKSLKEGKIKESTNLGKKVLAYPIKKQVEGIYWLLTLDAKGAEITALSDKLRQDEFILRHLVTKKE